MAIAEYSILSDGELASLLHADDHAAYTAIYERYFGLLYIHAKKRTGGREEARDLVQDLFLSLWNNRHRIEPSQNIKAYLYTALKNKIIDWMARQDLNSKYIHSFQGFLSAGRCETDYSLREKQLAELIEKQIMALPPRMREVFLLSRRQHMKNGEIARLLNLSEHTVKTQVKQALRLLRLRLGLVAWIVLLSKL